ASLAFVIPPAFVQTTSFTVLLALFLSLLLWGAYRLRLRAATRAIQGRMEERLRERERIARELHDTLLQGTYGLTLRFQAVADQIVEGSPVRRAIDDALERADKVMAEGRDRVEGLRLTSDSPVDLAAALEEAANEIAAGSHVQLRIEVHGEARALQ